MRVFTYVDACMPVPQSTHIEVRGQPLKIVMDVVTNSGQMFLYFTD